MSDTTHKTAAVPKQGDLRISGRPAAASQLAMPERAPSRVVDLGAALKSPPKNARTKRVGIVPIDEAGAVIDLAGPRMVDGFTFPANSGETDTNVVSHGGTVAPGVPVQLIFWGDSWTTTGAALQQQLIAAAMNLIDGPYPSAVGQYGLAAPSVRGSITIISPNPPASFDDGSIGDIVWACIDANFFPEPDDAGGRNYYCVFMPPGTSYGPGGALGAHSYPHDYDFPFDWDTAWVSWIGNSDLDTMTRAFGHELVETITDPEGDGWYVDSTGEEIGDICNTRRSRCKGVLVEGYWAKNSGACVIPQCQELISGVARSADHLDIFTVGTDGGIYTAAWEPDFADGWHGWWQINGGVAAPGTSVFAVSRSTDKLDVFVVGTDMGVYTAAWEPDFADGWHGWWRLGGLTVAPGTNVHAVSHSPDRLDIFAVGADSGIYTTGWSPATGWAAWTQINGGLAAPGTSVYGVSRAPGKLDIFAVGTDHGIYTAAWESDFVDGWHGWWQINGGVAAPGTSVFPVSRSIDHLDIFAVGTDHGIYTAAWEPDFSDGWHGWWQINGGVAAPGTSVFGVSRSADKLDIFAVGTDHGIYSAAWEPDFSDGWHGWWQIQGGVAAPGTSVFAVTRSPDHLDIFAVGTDHGTYTAAWEWDFSDGWHGWWQVNGGVSAWGM
jgi:hypothetical protein